MANGKGKDHCLNHDSFDFGQRLMNIWLKRIPMIIVHSEFIVLYLHSDKLYSERSHSAMKIFTYYYTN